MTAPALNSAQFAPPAAGATPGAPAAAGAAAGVFDALMASLFPEAAAPVPGKAQAIAATPTPEGATSENDADAEAAAEPARSEAAPAPVDEDAKSAGEDEVSALTASLAGAQPPAPDPTEAVNDAAATPPAWGREKSAGAPAQPAVTHANANADIAGKAAAAVAAADHDAAEPAATETAAKANTPTLPVQASETARAAVQQAPARQVAPAAAPPVADAPDVAQPASAQATIEGAEPESPPPPQAAALPGVTTAAAALAPRPEAQPAQPLRADKTDKKSAEAKDAAAAPSAAAASKSTTAKTTDAAANTAAAKADPIETLPGDVQAEADAPEAIQSAETRAASQSSAAAGHIAQPVRGSPETVAALAAQIIKKLDGKSTRFDVELDPAGLGKVDVRVEIGAHGRLVASLAFENPQAAQDLKARSGELQRALEQAGFDLSGGLSFDVAGDQRRQGQAWQEQADDNRLFQGRAFRQALDTAGEADTAATQGALRLRRGVSAGLDLRI